MAHSNKPVYALLKFTFVLREALDTCVDQESTNAFRLWCKYGVFDPIASIRGQLIDEFLQLNKNMVRNDD